MNSINFYGSIVIGIADEPGRAQKMAELLCEWLKVEQVNARMRLSGWEAVYEDDDLYLYCYDALNSPSNPPGFLLEGKRRKMNLDRARVWLEELMNLCRQQQIKCRLEYVEVDEAGDEVSEELSVN